MAEHRFVWRDRIHTVGASIGLVELARDSGSVEEILAAADSACYVAKKQGAGKVVVYSARDEVAARQSGEIHWLRTLQVALRDNLFRLYWQPIVPAYGENGSGPAMEVLVRLADEQGQELSPHRTGARGRTLSPDGAGGSLGGADHVHRAGSRCHRAARSAVWPSTSPARRWPIRSSWSSWWRASTAAASSRTQVCFEISESAVAAEPRSRAPLRRRAARHGLPVRAG